LKENVIIGKLIPAGTGLQSYRDIRIVDSNSEEARNIETRNFSFERIALNRNAAGDSGASPNIIKPVTKVLGTTVVYDDEVADGEDDFINEDGFGDSDEYGDKISDSDDDEERDYGSMFVSDSDIEEAGAIISGSSMFSDYIVDEE